MRTFVMYIYISRISYCFTLYLLRNSAFWLSFNYFVLNSVIIIFTQLIASDTASDQSLWPVAQNTAMEREISVFSVEQGREGV